MPTARSHAAHTTEIQSPESTRSFPGGGHAQFAPRSPARPSLDGKPTPRPLVLEPVQDHLGIGPLMLRPGTCTIGSSSDCTLSISVEGMARKHCSFLTTHQRTVLKAWDSRTWHNDYSVQESVLRARDRLQIGPIEFYVREANIDEFDPVANPIPSDLDELIGQPESRPVPPSDPSATIASLIERAIASGILTESSARKVLEQAQRDAHVHAVRSHETPSEDASTSPATASQSASIQPPDIQQRVNTGLDAITHAVNRVMPLEPLVDGPSEDDWTRWSAAVESTTTPLPCPPESASTDEPPAILRGTDEATAAKPHTHRAVDMDVNAMLQALTGRGGHRGRATRVDETPTRDDTAEIANGPARLDRSIADHDRSNASDAAEQTSTRSQSRLSSVLQRIEPHSEHQVRTPQPTHFDNTRNTSAPQSPTPQPPPLAKLVPPPLPSASVLQRADASFAAEVEQQWLAANRLQQSLEVTREELAERARRIDETRAEAEQDRVQLQADVAAHEQAVAEADARHAELERREHEVQTREDTITDVETEFAETRERLARERGELSAERHVRHATIWNARNGPSKRRGAN